MIDENSSNPTPVSSKKIILGLFALLLAPLSLVIPAFIFGFACGLSSTRTGFMCGIVGPSMFAGMIVLLLLWFILFSIFFYKKTLYKPVIILYAMTFSIIALLIAITPIIDLLE